LCFFNWEASDINREYQQAIPALEESLLLFREMEDAMGLSHTLVRRSFVAVGQRDFAYVRLVLEEVWTMARQVDDKIILGWVHSILGTVSWLEKNDLAQTKLHYEKCLSLFREARFSGGVYFMLVWLGRAERELGNYEHARALFEELVRSQSEITPDDESVDHAITGLAGVAAGQGDLERAVRLLGAVNQDALSDFASIYPELFGFERELSLIRAQLGDEAFTAAWAVGQVMTREQAIAYALQSATTALVMDAAEGSNKETMQSLVAANQSLANPLTIRELEVLTLLSQGYSNREIARQLVITQGTVRGHLNKIYHKLAVQNRLQAVTRAQQLSLL
jgi:ATP/maltotriose-dependent transcriptional regulator MalT